MSGRPPRPVPRSGASSTGELRLDPRPTRSPSDATSSVAAKLGAPSFPDRPQPPGPPEAVALSSTHPASAKSALPVTRSRSTPPALASTRPVCTAASATADMKTNRSVPSPAQCRSAPSARSSYTPTAAKRGHRRCTPHRRARTPNPRTQVHTAVEPIRPVGTSPPTLKRAGSRSADPLRPQARDRVPARRRLPARDRDRAWACESAERPQRLPARCSHHSNSPSDGGAGCRCSSLGAWSAPSSSRTARNVA